MKQLFSVSVILLCLFVVTDAKKYARSSENDEITEDTKKREDPHLSKVIEINDDEKVWIFDNVIQPEQQEAISVYLRTTAVKFQYVHLDYSWTLPTNDWNEGLSPWSANFKTSEFESFTAWKNVKNMIESTFQEKIHLENVQADVLRSLGHKPMMNGWKCRKNRFIALLFVNDVWQFNNYGQISFYSLKQNPNLSGEARQESVYPVHPKSFRMIVWPSCLTFIAHPPTVNYYQDLITLAMWFNTNETSLQKKTTDFEIKKEKIFPGFGDFEFTNADAERDIDYEKCLKRTFYDRYEKGIYVFDDLFTTDELRQLRGHLLQHEKPIFNTFETNPVEDGDNVKWISQYNVSEFLRTPIWRRVQGLVSYVSKEDQWFPYDVAMNYIGSANHPRIHEDAEENEHEYTFVLYLTEGLGPDECGETVWYEEALKRDGIQMFTYPGGEEYEPIAAVRPKFGRAVIFRNTIAHSARPLSTKYLGSRFSFAVKVSRNRRLSLVKQLYEKMEGSSIDKEVELQESLVQGEHNNAEESPLSNKDLEDMISTSVKKRDESIQLEYEQLLKFLQQ